MLLVGELQIYLIPLIPVRQCVSLSVCHQNFGLITTTKGLNTSKRHSNNDNSEKIVHGVPEGG